jgi:hypothetical protein
MTTMTTAIATPAQPRPSRVGHIMLLVFGTIVALGAMGSLAAGGFVTWANHTQRDHDGYFMTSTHRFASTTYAITQGDVDLTDFPSSVQPSDLGTIRVRATSADGKPIFLGIGRERAVDAWLAGVAHDDVTNVEYDPFAADYARKAGGAPRSTPAAAGIWAASSSGTGTKTVTWEPDEGRWTAVVMNADGSRGVAANVSVGANPSFLGWLEGALFGVGALLLAGGATMLYFGGRGFDGSNDPKPEPAPEAAA